MTNPAVVVPDIKRSKRFKCNTFKLNIKNSALPVLVPRNETHIREKLFTSYYDAAAKPLGKDFHFFILHSLIWSEKRNASFFLISYLFPFSFSFTLFLSFILSRLKIFFLSVLFLYFTSFCCQEERKFSATSLFIGLIYTGTWAAPFDVPTYQLEYLLEII